MMRIEDMKKIVDCVTNIQKTQGVKIDINSMPDGFMLTTFDDTGMIKRVYISERESVGEAICTIERLEKCVNSYKEKKKEAMKKEKNKKIEYLKEICHEESKDYRKGEKMKVLKIKFETDEQLEGFFKRVDLGCPSEYGEKDSETDSETCPGIDTCIKCWKNSNMIYEEIERLKSYDNEAVKMMIQDRIIELKNSHAGYMVCGISCNHAVVAELERVLKEIE